MMGKVQNNKAWFLVLPVLLVFMALVWLADRISAWLRQRLA